MSRHVFFATIVAALGALLFGFDTAVIAGTTKWLVAEFHLNEAELGFTVASALIGTILGSIAVGRPSDMYGRRKILYALALLYVVSPIGCALSWNWWVFLFFRFLGGLAIGGTSVVAPLYIAEIAPARYRGRLVAVTQLNIVLGILVAYLSNFIIGGLDLGANECRWMFGVSAFPAVMFMGMLFSTPESPRWLIAKGWVEQARSVLHKCGTDSSTVDQAIEDIQESLHMEHLSLQERLFTGKYLKPVSFGVIFAAFSQLSGINSVLYYTGYIFEKAGASKTSALLQSVIVGLTLLVFTVSAMAIIDRAGRKRLMVFGVIGYILSLSATAFAFYTQSSGELLLIGLLVFVASHAFGVGAVIWVFIGEIFPNLVRARGMALGCFVHWVMCAAITWTFPMIAEQSGGHAFAFYAAMMVLLLFWVIRFMPETKGVPLEEIQRQLGIV
jgi:SP family xylose:H+ symportor-like MFS transporter